MGTRNTESASWGMAGAIPSIPLKQREHPNFILPTKCNKVSEWCWPRFFLKTPRAPHGPCPGGRGWTPGEPALPQGVRDAPAGPDSPSRTERQHSHPGNENPSFQGASAELSDAAQYSLNQATGSFLPASADCSLVAQITCQQTILSSAFLQHAFEHSWTQGMLLYGLGIRKEYFCYGKSSAVILAKIVLLLWLLCHEVLSFSSL